MREPNFRSVALLPIAAIATGAVLALGTVVGQAGPAAEECPPGTTQMAGMDHGSSDMSGDMSGMDHSAHMAGGGGTHCMPAFGTTTSETDMQDMDHSNMSDKKSGSTADQKGTKDRKKATTKNSKTSVDEKGAKNRHSNH